jgi:hypothetical protein
MSRRSSPERLDTAREAATIRRLELARLSAEGARAWVAAWHAQAARDGLARDGSYWEAGWDWIAAERQRGAKR